MAATKEISLVGVGTMAEQHMRAIQAVEGLVVRSCASRSREKAERFAARWGIREARLIDDAFDRPEGDALWVVAPADRMHEAALRAAATGLPVFLEKPVGLDAAQTAAVAEAFRSPHMVGLNRRFYEVVRDGKRLIEENGGARFVEVHMPEDVRRLGGIHSAAVLRQWAFANSIHLIDLFRFFAGEATEIVTRNAVRSVTDRSYAALLRFGGGASGVFQAPWFAPGGWRVTVAADALSVTFAPIEQALVRRFDAAPVTLTATGPDRRLKPGLHGQAEAFRTLLQGGKLPDGAADLHDYLRSVRLVESLTVH